jgi:hypothetical protein
MSIVGEVCFCIYCKNPLPENWESGICAFCEKELADYKPPDIVKDVIKNYEIDIRDLFFQLTEFVISPIQEQLFIMLEGFDNTYTKSRQDGKTTFLLVYIIWKALLTRIQWAILYHTNRWELEMNKRLKRMLLHLTEDQMRQLDIQVGTTDFQYAMVRHGCPYVDTFQPREIEFHLRRRISVDEFSNFKIFQHVRSMGERRTYTVIMDPIF